MQLAATGKPATARRLAVGSHGHAAWQSDCPPAAARLSHSQWGLSILRVRR
jgi:hypothetical protein